MANLSLQFLAPSTDVATAIQGTFNPFLVFLSFCIASIAGYAALLITERIFSTEGQRVRHIWLTAGAFAMGLGIWAMHFIGMLAFRLPMPVNYDPTLTAFSILPASLASWAALYFMTRTGMSRGRLNLGGLCMASGIGAMHFTGMAAMIMNADMRYDPLLFVMSIAVAHVLATLALYSKFVLGKSKSWSTGLTNATSATILGLSICAMHYTAMAASFYFPGNESAIVDTQALSIEFLVLATTLVTGIVLGTAILATVVDRRLQEAHSQVKLILDSVGEGIYGINRDGYTTFVNPAAADMIGWKIEELIGKPQHEIIHNSQANGKPYTKDQCPIFAAIRDGQVHRVRDEVFWKKNGASFPVEYVSTPMQGLNGEISGAVVTFRDLTEHKQLETQLGLAQKMESIGQLAAGIAHEINTPTQFVSDNLRFLTESFGDIQKVLEVYAQVLQVLPRESIDPQLLNTLDTTLAEADLEYVSEEVPKALQQSLEGSERVGKIVRAMKEFSHPGTTEKKPIDLNQTIESTITVARNEWKYVADVVTDLEPTLPPVPCLPGEFNQVILNLLVNAAHAIGAVLETGTANKGTITVRTRLVGEEVEIRITDTGTGIPEAAQQKIFDPFFTTKEVGKGTGQGLAIAHDVITNKHGGRLTFETRVGAGTTFIIQLPCQGARTVEERDETSNLVCG